MRARDGRSVGELLLDCDLTVREVLMDTPLMDGRVMVRTWGEVVEAAGDLWRALPDPSAGTARIRRARDAGAALMEQLETMNGNLMKAARRRQWPGTGPADERLLQVCENLTLAAELLPRRRTDIRPMRTQVRADLEAAKARLMHVLYVGAHGVQVALNRDLRDLAVMPAAKRATLPAESMKRTVEARDRMAAFEQLAGSYVSATFPAALHGEHKPLPEPDRLRQALATWDIQAHRALAGTTTAATMMLVAQTQAHTAFATQTLLRAASETGAIEPRQYRTRLAPALESAQASWVALATTWAQLAPVSAGVGWTPTLSWRPTRSAPLCSSSSTTAPARRASRPSPPQSTSNTPPRRCSWDSRPPPTSPTPSERPRLTRTCSRRPAASTPSPWHWRRAALTATSPPRRGCG